MTDPTQAGQPSEEELRAYLEQLRGADPAEVLVQAYRMLGTGAEVKLGRADARLLIDAMNGMVSAVDGRVQADLVQQMRDGITQLQLAQVEAEKEAGGQTASEGEAAAAGATGQSPGAGGAGPGQGAQARPGGQSQRPAQAPGGSQRMTDRLWIPGRDPKAP